MIPEPREPPFVPAGHRPEIDGLRAIAVLAVVLFHAHATGFSGGFAGVDVFFTLSGYLIAQLIFKASAAGKLSFAAFYERRIRRIIPALFVMLAVSCAMALLMLPPDTRRFFASVAATAASLANFLFWRWSGYFESQHPQPLLHTWSLAVEEQFYMVFPVLAALLARRGRRTVALAIGAVALGSFAYSCWAASHDARAAFYSPGSRAWELMLGALLATGVIPWPESRARADTLAALGLALILNSFWWLTAASPFPGANALMPCAGAALVIGGTQAPDSRVARVLSLKPLVAVGLMSYSLYLWHWPLIVFGTYYVLDPEWSMPARIAMVFLSFPVAYFSWRFVELPFRGPHGLWRRGTLFARTGLVAGSLAALGLCMYLLDGLPQRFNRSIQHLAAEVRAPVYPCINPPVDQLESGRLCTIGDSAARPSFALWGDSHAAVFANALDSLARPLAVSGYSLTNVACPPLLEFGENGPIRPVCRMRNTAIFRALALKGPGVVILAAHWPAYFEAGAELSGDARHAVARHKQGYGLETIDVMLEGTARALRQHGMDVYFVEDVPLAVAAAPELLAKAQVLGRTSATNLRTEDYLRANAFIHKVAVELERRGLLHLISPGEVLCGPVVCRVTDEYGPLYFDNDHLNERGARLVSPLFMPALEHSRR